MIPACRNATVLSRHLSAARLPGLNSSIVISSTIPTGAAALAISVAACRDQFADTTASLLSGIVDSLGCRRCIHLFSTTPAHFPTSDGEFHSPARLEGSAILSKLPTTLKRMGGVSGERNGTYNYTCTPLTSMQDSWRNQALRRAALLAGAHFHDSLMVMPGLYVALARGRKGRGQRGTRG